MEELLSVFLGLFRRQAFKVFLANTADEGSASDNIDYLLFIIVDSSVQRQANDLALFVADDAHLFFKWVICLDVPAHGLLHSLQ